MGIYKKYLVCYDIENDKTRKKVFDLLKDLGLIHLQLSIFYGDLNKAEFNAMKYKIKTLLENSSDKCLWIRCDLNQQSIKDCVGYSNFSYIEPDGYESI